MKDLLSRTLRHEETERAPWVPFAGVHAGKLKGYTATEMLTDADKAFGRSGIRSGNALSSGGAMTLAAQAGSTATAQVAKLIELYNAGQITEQQLKDLQYSILNPNK